jgi:hypothetical protein
MAKLVVQGATLRCSMGAAPASFSVAVPHSVDADETAAGTIDDYVPNENVPAFGMCQSPSNPQVAAATSAAMGVLTPQPCLPVITAPWTPGASVTTVADRPALTDGCQCVCQWGGSISVTSAGQEDVEVD